MVDVQPLLIYVHVGPNAPRFRFVRNVAKSFDSQLPMTWIWCSMPSPYLTAQGIIHIEIELGITFGILFVVVSQFDHAGSKILAPAI